jgi:thiosulfate/3-mercaptopyruvate sulfurtransferase
LPVIVLKNWPKHPLTKPNISGTNDFRRRGAPDNLVRTMHKTLLLGLILLTLVVTSQAQKPAHPDMLVTSDWLAAHLKDPNVVVLHLTKEKKQYDGGHVPGARWISFDQLMVKKNGVSSELPPVEDLVKMFESLGVSNDSRVVVYSTNWPPLSTRIYFTLDYLGLGDHAAVLDGGLEKWKAEKRAVSTEEAKITEPGKIVPHVRPEIVATLDDMKAASAPNAAPVIVDSRPEKRYLEGHVPGAVHLYWEKNTQGDEGYTFLPASTEAQNYAAIGATSGKKLITYCEIGWQASHDYFTAKYLGYDVKMYDGSYQEWNEIKRLPVVVGENAR